MKLSEKDVIQMVAREYERKMGKLTSKYGKYMGDEKRDSDKSSKKKAKKTDIELDTSLGGLLARGIRLSHKDSGLEYTVISASPRDVILRNTEGRSFTVSADELNRDYELD